MGLPWKEKKNGSTCQDEWFPPRKKIRRILHGEGKTLVFDVQTKLKAKQIAGRFPPLTVACLVRELEVFASPEDLYDLKAWIFSAEGNAFQTEESWHLFWVPKGFFP